MKKLIGTLLLGASLMAPVSAFAADRRYYDRDHRDYHNWDDREDHAYRRYLTENRRGYVEYNTQNDREQRNYWKWRHKHPDHD